MDLFELLKGRYNTLWRHFALGYLSPNDFERGELNSGTSPLVNEILFSVSVANASSVISQYADPRGKGRNEDILQQSISGLHLLSGKIVDYSPIGVSGYLPGESG